MSQRSKRDREARISRVSSQILAAPAPLQQPEGQPTMSQQQRMPIVGGQGVIDLTEDDDDDDEIPVRSARPARPAPPAIDLLSSRASTKPVNKSAKSFASGLIVDLTGDSRESTPVPVQQAFPESAPAPIAGLSIAKETAHISRSRNGTPSEARNIAPPEPSIKFSPRSAEPQPQPPQPAPSSRASPSGPISSMAKSSLPAPAPSMVSESDSARESEPVPSESPSQFKGPSQNLTSTVESESDEGGAVSNPRRRRAARSPVQASVPLSRKIPVPEPDSSSDEADLPRSLRDSPGTPSKSSSHVPRPLQASQASSIDSEAPRVPRSQKNKTHLQKRRRSLSPAEPSQPSQPTIVPTRQGLLESLNKFKEEFEKDHGTVTYWRLHDAKVAIETAPPSQFMDKGDVFASLRGKGVQLPLGKPIPEGSSREKINQFVFGKSGKLVRQSTSYLEATHFEDGVQRVPNYQSYTNIQRNILTADNENLKYIPLGADYKDHDENFQKDLDEQYIAKRSEDIKDFERAFRLRQWLDSWLETLNMSLDQPTLRRYVLTLNNIENILRRRPKELDMLRDTGPPLTESTIAVAKLFCETFKTVFGLGIEKVVWPKDLLKEELENAKKEILSSPEQPSTYLPSRVGTYVELTCLICGIVDCPTHGEFDSASDQDDDIPVRQRNKEHESLKQHQHRDTALPYRDTLRRYLSQKATRTEKPILEKDPCSDECHMSYKWTGEESEPLGQAVIDSIREMMIIHTDKTYQSCQIAFGLALPCWQVYAEIDHINIDDTELLSPPPINARARRPEWYDNKKKTLKGDWSDLTNAHLHQMRKKTLACQHNGPCGARCPCTENNILCERYCGCGDDCPRKFTGCACSSMGINCVADSCICVAMNRECGPECVPCGAVERINPANKYADGLFLSGCQNIYLQRGVFKKLVMGESQLEGVGFGLYVIEDVKKGEFLSEYAGELISGPEAERRGLVYDHNLISFLFDLNSVYVVDAAKLGNKTRFINHAICERDGLNCAAKVTFVNGEHRIKFVALRDIKAGEELLFNYGREFAEKHGLSKKLPQARSHKKGAHAQEDEDGVDALDGVAARKRMGRGQMKAIRGRAGRHRGKAAKVAPQTKSRVQETQVEEPDSQEAIFADIPIQEDDSDDEEYHSPEDEDEDEEDEVEEEEVVVEEEEVVVEERPRFKRKREVKRPARYTR